MSDRKKQEEAEAAQNVKLAVLETKIDAIPEKMNGKIIAGLQEHMDKCPGSNARAISVPGMPVYMGPIAPDGE
jgi:hypothetical protein